MVSKKRALRTLSGAVIAAACLAAVSLAQGPEGEEAEGDARVSPVSDTNGPIECDGRPLLVESREDGDSFAYVEGYYALGDFLGEMEPIGEIDLGPDPVAKPIMRIPGFVARCGADQGTVQWKETIGVGYAGDSDAIEAAQERHEGNPEKGLEEAAADT